MPRIKGSHYAMKSGMLAAESIVEELWSEKSQQTAGIEPKSYEDKYTLQISFVQYTHQYSNILYTFSNRVKSSFIWKDLYKVRNARPSFHTRLGLYGGLVGSGFTIFMGGREPWTLSHGAPDYKRLQPINESKPINYPKPDNKITFDLLSSVALTGTNHEGTYHYPN